MYAVKMSIRIDPDMAAEASATFSSTIIPQLKDLDGYLKSYWLDPVEGEGFGFAVFATQKAAESALDSMAEWFEQIVVLERAEIRRIAAEV